MDADGSYSSNMIIVFTHFEYLKITNTMTKFRKQLTQTKNFLNMFLQI